MSPNQLTGPHDLTASIVGSIYPVKLLQLVLPPCLTPEFVVKVSFPSTLDDVIECCRALRKILPQPRESRYWISFSLFTRSYAFW